jgi:hypothetical protein
MIVITYKCPKCGWIIYQRCNQDIHTCFCSSIRADGKILDPIAIKNSGREMEIKEIELDSTKDKLILDFNYNQGFYGTIKPEK